jgi:hypothetical protein
MSVLALYGLLSTAHAACLPSDTACALHDSQSSQDDEEETQTNADENNCQYMSYMLPSEACMNNLHDELACSACPKMK